MVSPWPGTHLNLYKWYIPTTVGYHPLPSTIIHQLWPLSSTICHDYESFNIINQPLSTTNSLKMNQHQPSSTLDDVVPCETLQIPFQLDEPTSYQRFLNYERIRKRKKRQWEMVWRMWHNSCTFTSLCGIFHSANLLVPTTCVRA